MAKLDKSQGFTFVCTDLYEPYQKTKESEAALRDIEVASPLVVKRPKAARRKAIPSAMDPLESLRKNIDRLGEAQSRLRFLIQELDNLTKNR